MDVAGRFPAKELRIVDNNEHAFPKVQLDAPASSGYLLTAAEVDRRPPFLPNSRAKQRLLEHLKVRTAELRKDDRVLEAVVFDAFLFPPGRGEFLKERSDQVHPARFDVAVLIETTSPDAAREVAEGSAHRAIVAAIREAARHTHSIRASNVKRIAPVDHTRDGMFLFNFFFADDTERNLAVWEYTAGWFQHETGLDNSTVLLPEPGQPTDYNIINHCRWDTLRDFLPSLILKRSFRDYVLANFRANNVAAQPIIYRIA